MTKKRYFKEAPEPWERFRMLCEPGCKDFYFVEIHHTQPKMVRALACLDESRERKNTLACCFTYEDPVVNRATGKNTTKITAEQGTLFFYKNLVGPDVLAHEFFHAAMRWSRRRGIDIFKERKGKGAVWNTSNGEERVAKMIEFLTRQFYAKQRKRTYFICGSRVSWKDLCSSPVKRFPTPFVPDGELYENVLTVVPSKYPKTCSSVASRPAISAPSSMPRQDNVPYARAS